MTAVHCSESCWCRLWLRILLTVICVAIVAASPVTAQLTVSTNFEGGAADIIYLSGQTFDVALTPPLNEGRGWPNWWFARIDGVSSEKNLKLHIRPNRLPWKDTAVLAADWSLPDRAAVSHDGATWIQSAEGEHIAGGMTYRIPCEGPSVWVAWGPPFLPSDASALIDALARRVPDAEPFLLATTRGGRPVRGIRMGATASEETPVFGVWVQARQHAWETGSSWVGRGFAEWIAGDDPQAERLRQTAAIYYVPIMDVDNVTLGAGGKEAVPRDHNRDWSDTPHYPEVSAAQKHILDLNALSCFDVFIDLHNPGGGERRPFFFGPMNLPDLPPRQQHNHARWLFIAEAEMSGPLSLDPQYRFATYVRTEEERNRMSCNWVRNNTAEHILSTTLETAWNTPHSHTDGYRLLGAQLGRSIARYLAENPRIVRE